MTAKGDKWRASMKLKYEVDDEGLSEIMRQRQQKSMLNINRQKGHHRGGFNKMTKEELQELGRKYGRGKKEVQD